MLTVVGLLLLGAAPASASSGWVDAETLTPPVADAGQPDVAVDAGGTAVAVWTGDRGAIEVVQRAPGEGWTAPVTLAPSGALPRVAVDAQGDALVAWAEAGSGQAVVRTALRPAGGTWLRQPDLDAGGTFVSALTARFAADGTATVSWETSGGLRAARRSAAGTWGAPLDLTPPGEDVAGGDVAFADDGSATVAWAQEGAAAGGATLIQTAVRTPDGAWEPKTAVSQPQLQAADPRLAVDGRGQLLATWAGDDGHGGYAAQAALRTTAGVWEGPSRLSASYYRVSTPQIAFDGTGRAIAVWDRWDRRTAASVDFAVEAAVRPAGGPWRAAAQLSPTGEPRLGPQLAVTAAGDAVAVWSAATDSPKGIQGARLAAGALTWSPAATLSPAGETADAPAVALDAAGNGIAIFRGRAPEGEIVQVARLDATPPAITDTSLPDTAMVGQPVLFAVGATDTWSALAPAAWSFGDGAEASGFTVAHTFRAPGRYAVTVTVVDGGGNIATHSGTIRVTPAPVLGGGTPPVVKVRRPSLRGVRLTNPTFRVGAVRAAHAATGTAPNGTTLLFVLSDRATMHVGVQRVLGGRRDSRGRCVASTAALRRRHAAPCVRSTAAGSITRYGFAAGVGAIPFGGWLGGKALVPGHYVATVSAANAAGRARAVRLGFTIIR